MEYQEFLDFDVDRFIAVADAWDADAKAAEDLAEIVNYEFWSRIFIEDPDLRWTGRAADDASILASEVRDRLTRCKIQASAMARLIRDTGEGWKECQAGLQRGIDKIESYGLIFDGEYVTHPQIIPNGTQSYAFLNEIIDEWEGKTGKEYASTCTEYVDDIAAYLGDAEFIDEGFQAVLQQEFTSSDPENDDFFANPNVDSDEVRDPDIPDSIEADPEAAADWWDSLSPAEQEWYIEHQYETTGWIDGLPAEVRHDANMNALDDEIKNGNDPENAKELKERILASRPGDPENPPIYLLGFDGPGVGGDPDAKIIASVGDPDEADHTAILVPGTKSDFSTVNTTHMDRAFALQQSASDAEAGSVATIMWLGYDAPDDFDSAMSQEHANNGADDFDSFVDGIRTSHQGDESHVTAIGHSYGSVLVAQSDIQGDGLAIDEMIVLGSPGLGDNENATDPSYVPPYDEYPHTDPTKVRNVSELSVDPDHFWAGDGFWDPIPESNAHGPDPSDDSFGGKRIYVGEAGHTEYVGENSVSLHNLGLIIAGQADNVLVQ